MRRSLNTSSGHRWGLDTCSCFLPTFWLGPEVGSGEAGRRESWCGLGTEHA